MTGSCCFGVLVEVFAGWATVLSGLAVPMLSGAWLASPPSPAAGAGTVSAGWVWTGTTRDGAGEGRALGLGATDGRGENEGFGVFVGAGVHSGGRHGPPVALGDGRGLLVTGGLGAGVANAMDPEAAASPT